MTQGIKIKNDDNFFTSISNNFHLHNKTLEQTQQDQKREQKRKIKIFPTTIFFKGMFFAENSQLKSKKKKILQFNITQKNLQFNKLNV